MHPLGFQVIAQKTLVFTHSGTIATAENQAGQRVHGGKLALCGLGDPGSPAMYFFMSHGSMLLILVNPTRLHEESDPIVDYATPFTF